jgi:hypothetical protein
MSNNQVLPPAPAPTPPASSGGFLGFVKNIPSDIAKGVSDIPVVGKALGTAMSWAGKPLQEIQKDYKFVHSLYVDHGIGGMLLGTAGILAGGAIGAIGGPAGIAVGADIGAALSRNILGRVVPNFQDSFNKSNDSNYLVSFGRDLSHGLGAIPGLGTLRNTNSGLGQVVSGIADASFDFEGDPLATGSKMAGAIKRGDNIAVVKATDATGNLLRDAEGKTITKLDDVTGKPIAHATLPFASSGGAVSNFLFANSSKILTADQLDSVLANPLMAGKVRAIDDIVDKAKNDPTIAAGYIHNTYGIPSGWSASMSEALSTATTRQEAVQILKQSLYSKELADSANTATGELRLPSLTYGKMLNQKIGIDRIRMSQQATNYNDQVNLLLPRKSAIMEPAVNPDGSAILDESGKQVMNPKTVTKVDPNTGAETQEQLFKLNRPALFSKPGNGAMMNALAGKIRTFTGNRALSFDTKANALSSEIFDPADPAASKTAMDFSYYSMPYRVALEHATKMITATDDGARIDQMHVLQQEVLKNFGVAKAQSASVFGQLESASRGNAFDKGIYAVNDGRLIGSTEMKPEYSDAPKDLAIVEGQRYKGSMLDLRDIRQVMRSAKAYGALYNPVDDFFTHYTNAIFAPLALLSPAFGLRVSSGEALHQIMRRGLPSYLGNVLAASVANMSDKYRLYHFDKIAQTLTETDKDAIEAEQAQRVYSGASFIREKKPIQITSNEVTKELDERNRTVHSTFKGIDDSLTSKQSWNNAVNAAQNARFNIMPLGLLANKFRESNLVPYFIKDKINAMDRYSSVYGNRMPPAGVSASHAAFEDLVAKENIDLFVKKHGHGNVPGQELAGLSQMDNNYHVTYAKNINMAAADMAQRDIARDYMNRMKSPDFKALSPDEQFASLVDAQTARIKNPNMYQDYRKSMDGYTKAVPESFAKNQVDYLQGLVYGTGRKVNVDLVDKIAKGQRVTEQELRKLPQTSLPIQVLGRQVMPTISDSLRRVEQMGYRKFVTPVMDYVSRQPLFADFFTRRLIANQPLIDMGLLSEDEAIRMTATQATREMIPAIHSPAIRSQFAVLHRNLLPFFFAQEQAMRRTGRLIMNNPQAFRDFQIIQQGLNNPGFVHTDANGQKYVVYPGGIGEAGNAIARGLSAIGLNQFTGLPTSITGNTASLLTVLPEVKMPGTSPFVNFALSELSKKFPWMDKAVNLASGGYPSQNFIDTFIPNSTMRDLFNAMNMDDRESTVLNSKLSAIMAAYYHGDLPENYTSLPAYEQQQILTKIEHNAQSNLIIKGLFSFFLPLAPTVSNDYYTKDMQTLRSEYLNLLKQKDPSTGATYTAAAALDKFLQDTGSPSNPNRALSYTVARSISESGGAYTPLANSTLDWISNNQSLLNNPNYSTAAPYLIPQVANDSNALSVENKLILNHFRAKTTSRDFLSALYVKQGWQDLSQAYNAYQADVKNLRNSGDKNGLYQAGQQWKAITDQYGQSNPIWYADYTNPTRTEMAKNAVGQFLTMQEKGLLRSSEQGQKISQILDNYKVYHQDLIVNTVNGKHLPGYTQARDSWYTYMDNLAAADPQLSNVVTSVFRRVV